MNAVISLNHFCELHGPTVMLSTQAYHCVKEMSLMKDTDDTISYKCEACEGLPLNHKGFVSFDMENRIKYLTKHRVPHSKVSLHVRRACVQSLSCEVTPGKEGPLFFGNTREFYAVSHTFSLKDSQARGFQRWFSITVVMRDKFYLLNSWHFLVKKLEAFIHELQKRASKVHDDERAAGSSASSAGAACLDQPSTSRWRPPANKARSLITLTGDKHFFPRIHLWFTWLLKAGADRWSEKFAEGLPILEMHQQQDIEGGFTLVSSTPDNFLRPEPSASCACDVPSNSYSIRSLYSSIGPRQFTILVYNFMIGRQVVIAGNDCDAVVSIINCLKLVIPESCYRAVLYSHRYLDRSHCNILGLPPSVEVPSNVVRLDVYDQDGESATCNFRVFWNGPMPDKYPTMLMKIQKVIENTKLKESVVNLHCISLREEWLNIAKTLHRLQGCHGDYEALLKSLGVQQQDMLLLRFWAIGSYCFM